MNKEVGKNPKNWTGEERDRLVGLFELLLRIDMRNNPDQYKNKESNV